MIDSLPPHRVTVLQIGGMPDHPRWQAVYGSLITAPGVLDVDLSLARGTAHVHHDARSNAGDLVLCVRSAGCSATILDGPPPPGLAAPPDDAPLVIPNAGRAGPACGAKAINLRDPARPNRTRFGPGESTGGISPASGERSTPRRCGDLPDDLLAGRTARDARTHWNAWLAQRSSPKW